jgi:hypothetical protein
MLLCGMLLACGNALARPLVLESHDLPIAAIAMAHAGDELIAIEWADANPSDPDVLTRANFYRRNAGQWVFQRTLMSETAPSSASNAVVAMSASVAGIVMPSGLHVFERTATGWIRRALDVTPRLQGRTIDVDGDTILATASAECSSEALVLSRWTSGRWAISARLPAYGGCLGGMDLDGATAIVHSTSEDLSVPAQAEIFERAGGRWMSTARFLSPESQQGQYGPAVAIHGALALVAGSDFGTHIYRRGATGWAEAGVLSSADSIDFSKQLATELQITEDYVLQRGGNISRNNSVVYVYRERADQTFEHLAYLVTEGPESMSTVRVSGNRVIGMERAGGPYEVELPASFEVPPLVQDDFESGASQWLPRPGSQFAIKADGATHVYRQASLAGDAAAIHSVERTNQSVSADIQPLAFNGADPWVGLMTRYTDEANYYCVTLRSSGRIAIQRMYNGVFTELASVPWEVVAGRHYRVTLESSGSRHAVFIDGFFRVEAYDSQLPQGRGGLRMYQASADFDNVVVTPGPLTNLAYTELFTESGFWVGDPAPVRLVQTEPLGIARVLTGPAREDQIVQADVTVDSFASSGSPWVGLIARYVDAYNYYYVSARQTNQLSLRKLTNGATTVLGTVSLPVTLGQPFTLRLEAIGDRLRVYVNDEVRIERRGAEVVVGRAGAHTNNAVAFFEGYRAYEP